MRRSFESRCPRCRIHKKMCFCDLIPLIANKTPVTIVMHHSEKHLSSNTAHLAKETLKNCEVIKRGLIGRRVSDELKLDSGYTYLYLYPDEDSVELNSEFLDSLERPVHLIVPDGSWSQARKFKRREPLFSNMQSVKVPYLGPSKYQLRRQKSKEGLATFEAIARTLGILEGEAVQNSMDRIFSTMVHRVLISRTEFDKWERDSEDRSQCEFET